MLLALVEFIWDPLSLQQTKRLTTLVRRLVDDYPTVNAESKATQVDLRVDWLYDKLVLFAFDLLIAWLCWCCMVWKKKTQTSSQKVSKKFPIAIPVYGCGTRSERSLITLVLCCRIARTYCSRLRRQRRERGIGRSRESCGLTSMSSWEAQRKLDLVHFKPQNPAYCVG